MNITYLGYANDLFLFCSGDSISVSMMYKYLKALSITFGLVGKNDKSSIYFCGVVLTLHAFFSFIARIHKR